MAQGIEPKEKTDSKLPDVSPKLSAQELRVDENLILTEEPYPEGWLLFNEYI